MIGQSNESTSWMPTCIDILSIEVIAMVYAICQCALGRYVKSEKCTMVYEYNVIEVKTA